MVWRIEEFLCWNQKSHSRSAYSYVSRFQQRFYTFSFATDFSYVDVLTQKNHEYVEIPISFMISMFKGFELKFSQVNKLAYAVYKFVKHYRQYLLKSRTKVIVPYTAIRNVLIQKELGEKRSH